MRVLARREVVSEREARLVVTPPPAAKQRRTPAPVPAAPAAETTRTFVTGDRVRARIAAQRKAAAAAARRRRHILLALVLVASGVGAAAALGRLPLWTVAIPAGMMLAFLVLARTTVRREHARWDAELVRLKVAASTSPVAPSATSDSATHDSAASGAAAPEVLETVAVSAEQIAARAHNEQGLAVVSGLDDTSSFPMGLLDDVAPTTDAGSLWDPLPVTLPTYVTKPRADRSVRTIDLQAPGVSSSGHDAASSALVADAATSLPPDDLPQRAVGS